MIERSFSNLMSEKAHPITKKNDIYSFANFQPNRRTAAARIETSLIKLENNRQPLSNMLYQEA